MRIAVTAVGSVCALGLGREALWEGLAAGRSGVGPLSGVAAPASGGWWAGQVRDLDPKALLGGKGYRNMSRPAQLLLAAVHLGFADRGQGPPVDLDPGFGLAAGTAFGPVEAVGRFDRESLTQGPAAVSPLDFPNTVWNHAAGVASIRFRLGGATATLANGTTAGLDALGWARDTLTQGRTLAVLAGGFEALSTELLFALAGSGGAPLEGIVPGEGACFLCLEPLGEALAAGRRVLGEVVGFAQGFDPAVEGGSRAVAGWRRAILGALTEAGAGPKDVELVVPRESGIAAWDAREEAVLEGVLDGPPRLAVTPFLGETLGAGGAFQAAAALGEMAAPGGPGLVLVTAGSPSGRSAALAFRRWEGSCASA